MSVMAGPFAALSGVSAALQPVGPWMGRWQVAARFADEAETALMFTPAALARDIRELVSHSSYHSIVLTGRDVLASEPFVTELLERIGEVRPVMLECDGQRPQAVRAVASRLALVQVVLRASAPDPEVDRAMESLVAAAGAGCAHALVVHVGADASDAQCLRLVERTAATSAGTMLVVHPDDPLTANEPRWTALLERATALHADVRLMPTLFARSRR